MQIKNSKLISDIFQYQLNIFLRWLENVFDLFLYDISLGHSDNGLMKCVI